MQRGIHYKKVAKKIETKASASNHGQKNPLPPLKKETAKQKTANSQVEGLNRNTGG
jgi:hypothetical protein